MSHVTANTRLTTHSGRGAAFARGLRAALRRAFALTTLALAVSLCVTVSSASAASAPRIRNGGTLNILAIGVTWANLDPIYAHAIQDGAEPFDLAYQPLFEFNAAGKLEPYLATGYSYSANHSVLTIDLRHGVKFQDGTPFNASAVVYNLDRTSNPIGGSACVPFFSNVRSITATNNYTVKLTFSPLYSALPGVLGADECAFMASPTAIQTEGANFPNDPVGTSPWKFVSQVSGTSITFSRWSGAWQKAHVNTITFSSLSSDQAVIGAVQANTAQLMVAGPQDVVLAKSAHLTVLKGPPSSENYLRLNMGAPPLNNILARKALAAATDTPAIIKALYQGNATFDQSWIAPGSWAFNGARVKGFPTYDPRAAAADVAQLPGGTLRFTLVTESTSIGVSTAEALAAQWEAVKGISVTISPVDLVTALADQHGKTYQVLYAAGDSALPDPDNNYYRQLYSTSTENQENFASAQFDNLVTEARETFSFAQRKKLYAKAEDIIGQQLPLIPIYAYAPISVYNKTVHGLQVPTAQANLDLSTVWLS